MSSAGSFLVDISRRFDRVDPVRWAEISSVRLRLPRLAPAFRDYRIVQISDFHIGTWINRSRLMQAVEWVNQQKPDLVAITGDFVTFTPGLFYDDLVSTLSCLKAPDGSVAVLGNHDHWTKPGLIRRMLSAAGVHDLSNDFITLRRGSDEVHIAGVDDVVDGRDCLESVLARLPETGAAILLAHEPDFADVSSKSGRFDLQLSGHSHGGQILLPRLGAPFLPAMSRKYPSGLYQVGSMYQYTNRGLGTAELQIRLNCRPEITVFNLQPAD